MKTLSPKLAVDLAQFAYKSKNRTNALQLSSTISEEITRNFNFRTPNATFHGISGTVAEHLLNHNTGFGFFGIGIPSGQHKGEIVLTFRGTNSLADGLTDFHCGVTAATDWQFVHAGFSRTFRSIQSQLASLLEKVGPRPVHCVGHSLGGALANMAANWIKKTYSVPVKLYTFGAPRVGTGSFARNIEANLDGTYRAAHRGDIITYVPIWPFQHAGDEYRLSACTSRSLSAHYMEGTPGYLNTAGKHSDYSSMAKESAVLKRAAPLKIEDCHRVTRTAYWAERIQSSLVWLLKRTGYAVIITATGGLSVYDLMARALSEIAKMSREYAEETKGLLATILRFCGKSVKAIDTVTYKLAKDTLMLLVSTLYKEAKATLAVLR